MEAGTKEYWIIHRWLNYHHGKASKCENEKCPCENPKRYEWALKKGFEYKKDITHFKQLCVSCHKQYDEHGKKSNIWHNSYSKHVGVGYCNTHKKWRARKMINSKSKFLGYFKTEAEAISAIIKTYSCR